MTKRSRKYFKIQKFGRNLNTIFNLTSQYQLAYLKIQQLKSRMISGSHIEYLSKIMEDSENELTKLIKL
jgi:hypothetical protein